MRTYAPVFLGLLLGLSAAGPLAAAADSKPTAPSLSVTQIVDKHVAARGGLQAWHAVQTLSVSGKLDAGTGDSIQRSAMLARQGLGASAKRAERAAATNGAKASEGQQVQLPFRLEMKRPHKSRLEVDFAGKTAVQVYDGEHGWKLRPFLNRDDVEPFTAEELKEQAARADIEPSLLDYASKGTQVALEGVDKVDGHNAYKLKLTLKGGDVQHVWIDAQSFLDVKVEGIPRRMDGKMRAVWIAQKDFRSVKGVMVPYVTETSNEGSPHPHRMLIETAAVNSALDDARFAKPQVLVAGSTAPAAPASPAVPKK